MPKTRIPLYFPKAKAGNLRLKSPAKINLFLSVLSKNKDGYHGIRTLFERISLCDEIALKRRPHGIKIVTDSRHIPRGCKNIAWRAALLLKETLGVRRGVLIKIKKKIPVAAGLGGGSSNAATVLMGLNRLWRLGLSRRELLRLGARLGSDVPFFILDTPFAIGRGRGEILKKIHAPGKKIWHCLVKPRFSISTRSAYEGLGRFFPRKGPKGPSLLTPQKPDARMLLRCLRSGDAKRLAGLLTNTLELALNKKVKKISEIKQRLAGAGALGTLMSGSGSSVFGVFSSKNAASRAARIIKKDRSLKVFVVSTY